MKKQLFICWQRSLAPLKPHLVLWLAMALSIAFIAGTAHGASITLQGTIGTDDAVQLFDLTVATAGTVDLRSYGYAGGTTSTGTVVAAGGFDTILTLFSASGSFLSQNDEGAGVATDPATGLAADARITTNLTAGNYLLALTQYDNFSIGNLADGFAETGNPNFTAAPNFTTGGPCPGNMFRDISGTAGRCRTGNWTVDFVNVANATPVAPTPEPSALLLAALGLALLLIRRCRRRGIAALMMAGLVAAVASVPVAAQTNGGPDYSNVSDYLNGQRTLLKITDLEVVAMNASDGPNYTQIKTSNSQQTISPGVQWGLEGLDVSRDSLQFSARMFNQPSASTITTLYNYNNYLALWIQDIASTSGKVVWTPLSPGDDPTVTCGAVADFTRSGYEDLALGLVDGRILLMAPNDPNDSSKGFRKSIALLNSLLDMAAGDFNGDGRPELAGLTVIPNDQPGGGGLVLVIYTVDPQSLAVTPVANLTLTTPGATPSNPVSRASITRGRFNGAGHDQLAVAFTTPNGPQSVEVIDFDANTLKAHEASSLSPGDVTFPYGIIQVKTGKFGLDSNPPNPFDQIVYASSSPSANGRFFEVLSVDPASLTLTAKSGIVYGNDYPYLAKIDVGNFDHRQPDPSHKGQTEPDLDDQIAFLYADTRNSSAPYYMNIYSVDPTSLNVQNPPNSNVSIGLSVNDYSIDRINFVATDLQGRSVTLGEPTIIDLSSTDQPSVVVGVPPMHVDFISPNPYDKVPPEILNLSAVPDGFKTTYTNQTTHDHPTSYAETTSWSFGAQEKFSYKDYVGDVDDTGGYFGDTLTAAQNLKKDTDTIHGTFTSQKFDFTNISGSDDVVNHQNQNLRIWVYPVIGKLVHPKDHPDQLVPLTIQFSAPFGDNAREADDGFVLPWYQPPWEPYNVLSYPANLTQLENSYQDPTTQMTTLSMLAEGTKFATDSNQDIQTTTWTVGTSEETDIGFNQNYSFESDTSVTGSVGVKGAAVDSFSFDLDLSGSYGLNTLTKDSTMLGESTGLEVSKQTSFPVPINYRYFLTPYIMGTTVPGGVVDKQKLNTSVQTFGILRAVFTANPLNTGGNTSGGNWWKEAYGHAPDVALNHPARWGSATLSLPTHGDPPSNCLATGSQNTMDCLEVNPRLPDNPGLSAFHVMRGLFISSGITPGRGPQLESAKAGDVLTLEARVYNYSLTTMPTGTEVHARFYFMPWDVQGPYPAEPNGNSYLINEVKTGLIRPFDDRSPAPNWELVQTTFDTSKFPNLKNGNVNILFWVVVWMQDQSGTMIGEIPAHGLTAIPPAGTVDSDGATTVHFPDVAKLECQADGKTCYSNNIGIYPQPFYIAGVSLGATPGSPTASVDIGKVELSANPVKPGQNVVVTATLSASDAAASGVSANFYDGDPKEGGRAIAAKRIPYLGQDSPYKIQTLYQTNTCGAHELFVVVNRNQPNEIVRRAEPLRVDCSGSR